MGIYSEYLEKNLNPQQIQEERKKCLETISNKRGRGILVFASRLFDGNPIWNPFDLSINDTDILYIKDQISNIDKKLKSIDVILETPGGSATSVEDIVQLLRNKFEKLSIIVPGRAKSAGTIFAMASDEILMNPSSALGPIDAQIHKGDKVLSAGAIIAEFDRIKEEAKMGELNKAYIPFLQDLNIGEIEDAKNANEYATTLVKKWLEKYMLQNLGEDLQIKPTSSETLKSKNKMIMNILSFLGKYKGKESEEDTLQQKKKRHAEEIANKLGDHNCWLTHGRSIKISDLQEMGIHVIDYSRNDELNSIIEKYYNLLQISFEQMPNMFKIFETSSSELCRIRTLPSPPPPLSGLNLSPHQPELIDVKCGKCNGLTKLQANFHKDTETQKEFLKFPKNNILICSHCNQKIKIEQLRSQIEFQRQQKIID